MFQVHGQLRQIPSTGNGSLQQHATLHHRSYSTHDVNRTREVFALDPSYPENEGKKKSSQVYVRDVIRRQQKLNYFCGRNTQHAKQRKRFDKKSSWCKNLLSRRLRMGISKRFPPKGTKKLLKKWRGPFMITEVHQEVRLHRLSTGRATHYEKIKPHIPSTEDCL